jgi:hypothetical protein
MTIISTRRPLAPDDIDDVLRQALREAARADWSVLRSARRVAFGAGHDPERLLLARQTLAEGHPVAYGTQARRAMATLAVAIGMTEENGGHAHGDVSASPNLVTR